MTAQQQAAMRQALEALEGFLYITHDSQGVKGYHLNGDIAEWDEFDEVDKAKEAITALRQALEQQPAGEPVAFQIFKPTPPRHAIPNVRDAELPWVYDQDPSSGNVASMWVTPVARPQPAEEPVAMRHSFDGYGWQYTDMGHGSGWKEWTLKMFADAEPVYDRPQPAAQSGELTPQIKSAYAHSFKAGLEISQMRMPKVGDRVVCIEDESLATVEYLTGGGSPEIKFDDGSHGTYLLREFAELFRYADAQPAAPAMFGGGLVAIKTLLSRDPCAHAKVAIEMIDAMLAAAPEQKGN